MKGRWLHRVESKRTQWVTPNRALPLSLFGDEEGEDDVVDPSVVDVKDSSANHSVFDLDFDGLNLNLDLVGGNEEFDGDDDRWEFKDGRVMLTNAIDFRTGDVQQQQSDEIVFSRVESKRTQWVTPNRALPLSLFGDEEGEDDVVDPSVVDVKDSSANHSVFDLDFDGLNLNLDLVGGNEEFDGDDDRWEFKDGRVMLTNAIDFRTGDVQQQQSDEIGIYW
ncbi:hypothetical protein F0562_001703 [Nyssa sinensis]|uniref:Uncharacterized protein n=1 Tax=Nyssa sinensis TaxID=561372 RepID=A0A5J5C4E4_9ASTE|nr:hypothetical protein F0562_001703 [Nyssa sinensis]